MACVVLQASAAASPQEPTPQEVAQLYVTVGRELSTLATRSSFAAIDLWPRFRWIRIMDALVDAQKRHDTYVLLERLRRDIATADR